MANMIPSLLVDGQSLFNEKLRSAEWRTPNSAALMVGSSGSQVNPEFNMLREREDRAVKAYFPIRQAAGGGTGREALHSGAKPDSLAEDITWSTFSEKFSISIETGNNNVIGGEMQYASGLKNAIFNIIKRADDWFVAALVADKTQVADSHGFGVFDVGVTNDYQLALAEEDLMFENIEAYLNGNEYTGGITGILDSKAKVLANKISNQGESNSLNTQFTVEGYDTLVATNKQILAAKRASGIFFETGLVGVINWIPKKNRKAIDAGQIMNNVGDFGSIYVDELGMDFAISAYATRADDSGGNGGAQDVVIQFEVSVDLGYVSAPLSTATASPVFSAALEAA
jgi:hypothetical protein